MQEIKRELFREPRQGVFFWIVMLLGCAILAYGLFAVPPLQARPTLLAVGLMSFLMGAAELLPRGWTTLAGLLRIGGFIALLLAAMWVVVRGLLFG